MDDTISRAEALDALTKYWEGISDRHPTLDGEMAVYADCKRVIKRLPSAQQWVSCKERLPEAYVDVLVWFEYYRYGDYNCLYQMHGIGTYIKEYDSWIINHETGWGKLRVFAWMPLPSPWKGGEE